MKNTQVLKMSGNGSLGCFDFLGRHPDRSRFSGGGKDLARGPAARCGKFREIPHPAELRRVSG